MAIPTPVQTIVNTDSDSSLNKIYSADLQGLSGTGSVGAVYVTNTQEYVTNYITAAKPGGVSGEVQFNDNSQMAGDTGFTYDPVTDSLTVTGNITAGNIKTDNILHANGVAWSFSGGSSYGDSNVAAYLVSHPQTGTYSDSNVASYLGAHPQTGTYTNSNVASYLPTYTGNVQAGNITINTLANLGAVGHVKITGGTSGQYLQTDGAGNLSWHTVAGATTPTLDQVTGQGAISTNPIQITDATEATNFNSGALRVSGGLGVAKQIHVGEHVAAETTFYAGHLADFSSWTVPKFVGRDAGAFYIQGALVNTSETGSADWVAYGDQSDDSQGWCDMGFTGTNFSDPAYSITKSNDGYIFVEGMPSAGGNLVLATGGKGGSTHRDIVFATGGFLLENERMRLDHERTTLFVGAHGDAGGTNVTNIDINGNVIVRSNISKPEGMLNVGTPNSYINFAETNGATEVSGQGNVWIYAHNAQYNFSTNGTLQTQSPFTLESVGNINYTVLGSPNKTWTLDNTGNLTVPGSIVFSDTSSISTAPKAEPNFDLAYATFTCAVGHRYMVDTVTQTAETTLPASPTVGQTIRFVDMYGTWGSNALIIHPNGKTVMGASGDYTISTSGADKQFVYNGTEWRVFG